MVGSFKARGAGIVVGLVLGSLAMSQVPQYRITTDWQTPFGDNHTEWNQSITSHSYGTSTVNYTQVKPEDLLVQRYDAGAANWVTVQQLTGVSMSFNPINLSSWQTGSFPSQTRTATFSSGDLVFRSNSG